MQNNKIQFEDDFSYQKMDQDLLEESNFDYSSLNDQQDCIEQKFEKKVYFDKDNMTQSNNDFVNLPTIYNVDANSYVSKSQEQILIINNLNIQDTDNSKEFDKKEFTFGYEHDSALSKRVDWCRFVNSL